MKIKSIFIGLVVLLFLVLSHFTQSADKHGLASAGASQSNLPLKQVQPQKTGLIFKRDGAFQGYTLFTPITSTETFLIDMEGRLVNVWKSDYEPGQAVYLLQNGHLLRTAFVGPEANHTFHSGGAGGQVQEFSWKGELIWDFEYNSDQHLLHHDIERLPNGNILMIAWEKKSRKEAIEAGRNPQTVGEEGLWPDHIIEVKPTGKTTGQIVWEWHVWDHLIQNYDSSKNNYGKVAEHPELINFNPGDWTKRLTRRQREKLESLGYLQPSRRQGPREAHPDWTHINSIDYNPDLDQILVSVLGFNEIWIIDHSTATKEAASHKGGRSGRGGDILYRWGNPQVYGTGSAADQQLFAQHDAQWIPPRFRGEGNILIFNNGRGRPDGDYSSIDEIVPPVNKKGKYVRKKGHAFGPAKPIWTYTAPQKSDFYSGHISGCQRLANGNTLICSGENGIFFEVTPDKDVVWKFINPLFGPPRPPMGGPRPRKNEKGRDVKQQPKPRQQGRVPGMGSPPKPGPQNSVFKAYRYAPDYPGLQGKDLTPGQPLIQYIKKKIKG
ncbi:MAG: aryl-sulfate sulfotransferase [Candidatus Aminicenantales bacterium]